MNKTKSSCRMEDRTRTIVPCFLTFACCSCIFYVSQEQIKAWSFKTLISSEVLKGFCFLGVEGPYSAAQLYLWKHPFLCLIPWALFRTLQQYATK